MNLNANILIVEDDIEISKNLYDYFSDKGFTLDYAYDGLSAISLLSSQFFDALVLDIGLPRQDGMKVIEYVRQHLRSDIPIFVISGRVTQDDILAALKKGADDYLTKPFSLAELELRMRNSLLRYKKILVNDEWVCGDIRLQVKNQKVYIRETEVRLRPKIFHLLSLLIKTPDQLVAKAELENEIWGEGVPDGDALRGLVHALRRVLQEHGCQQLYTVHGVGYSLQSDSKHSDSKEHS